MAHLRSIPFATCACLLAACAAPDRRTFDSDPAYLVPQAGRATLIVVRTASVADDDCVYAVAIDANAAGHLPRGGWITMYPPAGGHVLSVRSSGAACPAGAETRVRVDADRNQRMHVVRATTGALQWKDDGGAP